MRKKIREVMTRPVETARPDMTLTEAAERMRERSIGSLPVCEEKRVVGIVTDRDITIRAVAEGRDPARTLVSEVMTRDVVSVGEGQDLEEAERLMHDRQIRRLPVVDANLELVGYLAMAKVARTEDEAQAGRVLKGVSQPSAPPPMESFDKPRGKKKKTG